MKFKNILKHITGLSVPGFGIQWSPPKYESDIAEQLLLELEDKRVLYNPISMEDANHCVFSVNNIRENLTNAAKTLDRNSPVSKTVKKLRSACRQFCNIVGHHKFLTFESAIQNSILERELFKLRDRFGKGIAEISVAYGIDVEDDLASIIPFNNFR